jgi:hypothetical protein
VSRHTGRPQLGWPERARSGRCQDAAYAERYGFTPRALVAASALRAIRPLAALDLGELADQLPVRAAGASILTLLVPKPGPHFRGPFFLTRAFRARGSKACFQKAGFTPPSTYGRGGDALRDHFAFVLRHGREDVHGQLVGVRVIDGHKFNAAVHQRDDECQIAGQPIEFGPRTRPCARRWPSPEKVEAGSSLPSAPRPPSSARSARRVIWGTNVYSFHSCERRSEASQGLSTNPMVAPTIVNSPVGDRPSTTWWKFSAT